MPENSKKILILTTAYKPFIGGSEIAIEEITKRLPNIFFDIVTPRFKKNLPGYEKAGNISIHRVGRGNIFDKFFFPIFGAIKAKQILKTYSDKIAHAYQASYAAGAGWFLKVFSRKVKFFLTLQEGENLNKQNFLKRVLRSVIIRSADVITVISNYLKAYAAKINKDAKIFVIPNGVDLVKFNVEKKKNNAEARKNIGVERGAKVIITASRLVPKNGIADLIEAFAILEKQKKNNELRLLIVGQGTLENILKSKVKKLGLSESVIMTGGVSHNEIANYFAIADVFVRPSYSEGLGNAFLEAMAMEVPIIGTQVGGIPDFLEDGETGLFCKIGDPNDLADKINQILENQELAQHLAAKGLALIKQKYDWGNISREFLKVYEQRV